MRTLQSELINKGFSKPFQDKPGSKNTKRKNKEKLSFWELEDLMGTRRDTFYRGKGGAIKRR